MEMFKDKNIFDLHREFEENGWVQHICKHCGQEMEPSEPDATRGYCSFCETLRAVDPLI